MTFHFGVKKRLKGHIAVVFRSRRQTALQRVPGFSSSHFALVRQIMDPSDLCELIRVALDHSMAIEASDHDRYLPVRNYMGMWYSLIRRPGWHMVSDTHTHVKTLQGVIIRRLLLSCIFAYDCLGQTSI